MHHRHALASAALVFAAAILPAASQAQVTLLTAKLNGDDQFKLYLSVKPSNDGFQFLNGYGWAATETGSVLLPIDPSTGLHFKDYWVNIWVQDVGGGGPDVLGAFKLSGPGGCKFDNATTTLLTDATSPYWHVTPAQPWSPGGPPVPGFPSYVTNYTPPFVQPMLTPLDLGPNGVPPWGPMPAIPAAARWMSDPAQTSFSEAWFQAHFRCKK